MKQSMCENCIKYKTIYCPNSDECLAREDKPFYEDKYTILTKNEALEGILKDYTKENQQLKRNCNIGNENLNFYREEYKKLEDNWNRLKEYISKNIIYDDVGMKNLDPSPLEDKIQELERGVSDDNN